MSPKCFTRVTTALLFSTDGGDMCVCVSEDYHSSKMGETCVCVCVCVCEDNHSSKMGERCVGCGPVSLRGKVIWYCLQNTALIDSKTSRPQPCGTLKWVSHSNECTLNGVVWPYCWGVSHLMKADMGKRISPYKVNYNSNDLKMKVETGLSLSLIHISEPTRR